ncbi:hypothetical protein DFH07DRAFT_935554 [Mycena maculata]|uniref:Uncharacterized protein n=1 Tax=Mycena maculata TaxID=230809 RepID=A0AAD7KBJ8_9AGAR|nr:hypothetical protein DFH07DRAFT_935554 [Mycena maculata]
MNGDALRGAFRIQSELPFKFPSTLHGLVAPKGFRVLSQFPDSSWSERLENNKTKGCEMGKNSDFATTKQGHESSKDFKQEPRRWRPNGDLEPDAGLVDPVQFTGIGACLKCYEARNLVQTPLETTSTVLSEGHFRLAGTMMQIYQNKDALLPSEFQALLKDCEATVEFYVQYQESTKLDPEVVTSSQSFDPQARQMLQRFLASEYAEKIDGERLQKIRSAFVVLEEIARTEANERNLSTLQNFLQVLQGTAKLEDVIDEFGSRMEKTFGAAQKANFTGGFTSDTPGADEDMLVFIKGLTEESGKSAMVQLMGCQEKQNFFLAAELAPPTSLPVPAAFWQLPSMSKPPASTLMRPRSLLMAHHQCHDRIKFGIYLNLPSDPAYKHLWHSYFTTCLIPTLLATGAPSIPVRIINTSFASEVTHSINFNMLCVKDSPARKKAGASRIYAQSKFVRPDSILICVTSMAVEHCSATSSSADTLTKTSFPPGKPQDRAAEPYSGSHAEAHRMCFTFNSSLAPFLSPTFRLQRSLVSQISTESKTWLRIPRDSRTTSTDSEAQNADILECLGKIKPGCIWHSISRGRFKI